jgi:DNA (cytosine-5)-methyltransferase 1
MTAQIKTHRYSLGEMFCGPGGLGLGARQASVQAGQIEHRFHTSWALDNHSDTCSTYENNILADEEDARIIHADIEDYPIDTLPDVDGFLYGFPCNDFSLLGKSKGMEGLFGPLYTFGVDYINSKNPKFILAENVSGIRSSNDGGAFKQILDALANAGSEGYNLSIHKYRFEEYGIPQARHRFIIIGFRNDLDLSFRVPAPSMKLVSVRECLENPPIPQDALNNEFTRQSENVIKRLKHTKPGENAWTADLPEDVRLNVKGATLSQIYKRLDPDKPSYTITGSGGGGTHVYHWSEPRALTNRERARLQTFPDDFEFHGSKESVRRQIGMAVPVEGARIILEAVLKTFAGMEYDSVPTNYECDQQLSLPGILKEI